MIDVRRDYYCAFGNSIANCLRENKTIICSSREHQPQVTTIEVSYFAELITMQGIKILSLSLSISRSFFAAVAAWSAARLISFVGINLSAMHLSFTGKYIKISYCLLYWNGFLLFFIPSWDWLSTEWPWDCVSLFEKATFNVWKSVLYFVIYEWHKD